MMSAVTARQRVEDYIFPRSLEECVKVLSDYKGDARIIAGGTDLLLWAKAGKIAPRVLVDISRIEGMSDISVIGSGMRFGAAATHAAVAADERVNLKFMALAEGCRAVGSPQIRHIATLGGNIVSAQPAADSVIPMVALDAECEIVSLDGVRVEHIESLHLGVGKSTVDPTKEVISGIRFHIPNGRYATAFTRTAPREAMALPIINTAVRVLLDGDIITSARIAVAPVAIKPFRASRTEKFLEGKKLADPEVISEAGRIASEEANPRDSLQRGSGEYRKVLVGDLVEKALISAANNIREGV